MSDQQLDISEIEMVDEGIGDTIRLGTLLTLLAIPGVMEAKDIESNIKSNKQVTTQVIKDACVDSSSKETYGGFTSIQAANIIAKTLFMEARGEGEKGINAVASVIFNRGNTDPQNFPGTCLKKKQFVCWNDLKTRTPKDYIAKVPLSASKNSKDAEMWKYCQSIAGKMLNKTFQSTIGNRNAYHTTKSSPYWSSSMANKLIVGNHIFGYLPEYDANRKTVNAQKTKKSTSSPKQKTIEKIYIVKKGDTLSKIAIDHKTTVEKILKLNQELKKNPNKIKIGTKLKLPS